MERRVTESMWQVARRPRWIALLLFALGVAAGFAALGQWQLERSIASGAVIERDTETVRPLGDLTSPQAPVTEEMDGQRISVGGSFVGGDYSVISDRLNGGVAGYWVIGHLQTDAAASASAAVAVALGWTADAAAAESAAEALDLGDMELTGRYVAPESPSQGDFESGERSQMAPSAFVNEWASFDGRAYSGYVVATEDVDGLARIDAPVPTSERSLNWLNLFYAVEWAVFAVFAVFLWYRLVKDAFEREQEEAAEAAAAAGTRTDVEAAALGETASRRT